MIKTVKLRDREITYDLQRKRVKNINLRIKPNGKIFVSASSRVPVVEIEKFMIEKADFILRALERYAEIIRSSPKPKQYSQGEEFDILGERLSLRLVKGNKNFAELSGEQVVLTVRDTEDFELKKRVMDKLIRNRFKEAAIEVCRETYADFEKYGVAFPEIRVRAMTSRWGSCCPKKGILTFNTALARAPLTCLKYVAAHEFVHFLQPNHSKEFYKILDGYMPDWRERKKLLECGNY